MARMTLDEMIAVIAAYKDGADIECDSGDDVWVEAAKPVFNFLNFRYRVKPTPRATVKLYKALVRRTNGCTETSYGCFRNIEEAKTMFPISSVIRLLTEYPIEVYEDELK